MPYSIKIKGSAAKSLERIPATDRRRLLAAIDGLESEPHAGSALKGALTGLRRLRVGRYRIVYDLDNEASVVLIVRVAHRREVYR